jgi:hypothetical protein
MSAFAHGADTFGRVARSMAMMLAAPFSRR